MKMKCLIVGHAISLPILLFAGIAQSPFDEFRGWEKKIVAESADIGAFENGSFEDTSKYGKSGSNGMIGRFGVNGGGGLKITDIKGNFGHNLELKVPLKKGVRYVFSADVRPHGKAFGRIVMDGFLKAGHKYIGAWFTNYGQKDTDGWVHETVEYLAEQDQEEVECYVFKIYCGLSRNAKPGPENYVEVDNVKIESAAPKWYFCNVWPMHNQIYADEGRVRINSSFFGDFFEKDAQPAYACRLVTEAGESLGERVATPDANGNFTLDFGKFDYAGKAKLEATLYDRAARLNRGTRTLDLAVCVPDRTKRLFVKENGVVLKDGKPFMPLGFYTGLANLKYYGLKDLEFHLKRLHDAGFDTTMDYHCWQLKGKYRDDYYALYDKYGMWMLNDDFKVWINDPKFDEKFPGWEKLAKELAQYPSIIGFYIMDENPEDAVPRLARLRRMLNEVAPGRMVNICNIQRPPPFLPACDIPGGDSYPVKVPPTSCLRDTHARVAAMKNCGGNMPLWWAPQCFNWAWSNPAAKTNAVLYRKLGREPTHEENLAVALCNAADGVNGFIFFAYYDILECPVPEYRESRWNSMCKIAKVLRRLEPFIMSGEKIIDLLHKDGKDETIVKALSDGKGHYRVIVCGLGLEHETIFALPPEYGDLKPLTGNAKRENGQWVFRGKAFSCDLLE